MLDQDDNILSGWQSTIAGLDNIRIPVHFNDANFDDVTDKPTKIKFELKNAQLYGFQIKP